MISLTISKILLNIWFWFAVVAAIIAVHYFWGKTPPPPKPDRFSIKHRKTINKVMDICIILLVLGQCLFLMAFPVIRIFDALLVSRRLGATELRFAWVFLLVRMINCSGLAAVLIGVLSIFQSNLTKVKRLILLIICLLPTVFTIIALLIEPADEHRLTIEFGLIYLCSCWVINGPAVILGRHLFLVFWGIMRKLRLVSGDYPG